MRIVDGFHRALRERLEVLRERKCEEILNGYGDDPQALALKYKHDTGYLRALADVGVAAEEIERKLYPNKDAA